MSMIQKLDERVKRVISESRLDLSLANEVYSKAVDLYLEIPKIAKIVAKEMRAKEINEPVFFATLHRISEYSIVRQDRYLAHAIALEKNRLKNLEGLRLIADFIKEPEYREKSLNWDNVCLDSTYHALDACLTMQRIKKYRTLEASGKKDEILVLQRTKPSEWKEECYVGHTDIEQFLLPLFDEYSGGFRQCQNFEPDVYSTDDACRLIFDLIGEDKLPEKLSKHLEQTYSFLLSCQDQKTGAFSDRPFLAPCVSMTFAAVCSLSKLIGWFKSRNIVPQADFQIPLDKTIEYLYQSCARSFDDMIGFADTPYDEPLLCSTFFVLRTIRRILELQSRKLAEVVNRNVGRRIIEFVRNCWVEQDGGYSCKLNAKRATLIHTRYAILTTLELFSNDIVGAEHVTQFFRPTHVLKFVFSCYLDGGFGTIPGITPTVYSTRAALKIIEYLELLRIRKEVKTDVEYEECMKRFDDEEIAKFLSSCYDRQKLGFAGLPLG